MTRSPFAVTLVPLLPLAALAWPLSQVMKKTAYLAPPPAIETPTGPVIEAYLSVQSAHPFESLTVTIKETSWTFGPEDDEAQVSFPDEDEVILTVKVVWPEGTPETAVKIRLQADNREDRSKTLWGFRNITEEIAFSWEERS
jgi:hypothetical protein